MKERKAKWKKLRSDLSSVAENTKQLYERSLLVHRNIILSEEIFNQIEQAFNKSFQI